MVNYQAHLEYIENLIRYSSLDTLSSLNSLLKIDYNKDILDFAKKNIKLPPSLARNEYYSIRDYPYLKEPFELMMKEGTREIFFYKSTQSGVTIFMIICSLYFAINDPAPQAFYMPTLETINRLRVEKYNEIINHSYAIKQYFGNRRDKDNVFSKQLIRNILGTTINFSPMGTTNSIRSSTIKRAFADEISAYENSKEGDPIDLIRQRIRVVDGSTLVSGSTPTNTGSYIDKEWEKTDKRYYHVPCLKCGTYQTIDFERLIYNKKAKNAYEIKEVFLECLGCNRAIPESERREMLGTSPKWIPSKEAADGVFGFHITHLMTPQEDMFKRTVQAYVNINQFDEYTGEYKIDYQKKQVFYNNHITRNYDQAEELMFVNDDYSSIYSIVKGKSKDTGEEVARYLKRGAVPPDVHTITVGIDVQHGEENNTNYADYTKKPRIEIHYLGISDSNIYSIDYDVIHGGNNGKISFLDIHTFKYELENKILRKFKTKPNKYNALFSLKENGNVDLTTKEVTLSPSIAMIDLGGTPSTSKGMIEFYISKFNKESPLYNTRIQFCRGMGLVERKNKLRIGDNFDEKIKFKTSRKYSELVDMVYHNLGLSKEILLSDRRYSDILTVYQFNTNVLKKYIFDKVRTEPASFSVPSTYPKDLIAQLFSEKMVQEKNNEITFQKIKSDVRNEFLDTSVYGIGGFFIRQATPEYAAFDATRKKVKKHFETVMNN